MTGAHLETRRSFEFESQGAVLRGTLYLPEAARPPIVVMAHGFSATAVGMTADRYAEVFQAAGLAVLLYDHFGLGRSDGEPRLTIDRWIEVLGYRDAIDAVCALDEVDGDRVAVWGDSASGALAIVVAAFDARVRALVAQVPACGRQLPPADPGGEIVDRMAAVYRRRDRIGPPNATRGPMPVVSPDQLGMPSALSPITAFRWFIQYGAVFGTGWENRITLADRGPDEAYQPVLAAGRITASSLFLIAPNDEMPGSAPAVARAAFDAIQGPKELVEIEGGHFGLLYHPGPIFERSSGAQVAFLRRAFGID